MDQSIFDGTELDGFYARFDLEAMPMRNTHRKLSWDEMPTSKLLQEHGYRGRISPFYRGSNIGPTLADLYVDAYNYGWKDALKQRYIPTSGNPHLHRLGLSSTAQILLPGNVSVNSLRRVIAAYHLLHLEPGPARDVVYYPKGDSLLNLIFERNGYHDLADMPVEQVAFCLLILGNLRNTPDTGDKLLNWNWRSISFAAAWDNLEATPLTSPFFQLVKRYTLAEILQLATTVEEFNAGTIIRMSILRAETALPLEEVAAYLSIPDPLFKDLFGPDTIPRFQF